jgi:hypothetical protein
MLIKKETNGINERRLETGRPALRERLGAGEIMTPVSDLSR